MGGYPSNQDAHQMRIFPHPRCASDAHLFQLFTAKKMRIEIGMFDILRTEIQKEMKIRMVSTNVEDPILNQDPNTNVI